MIRRAALDDIPEIIRWGHKFYEYSPWLGRVAYNEVDLAESLRGIIENSGAVFLNGHGICGGLIFPLYFNASVRVAVELFWFAESGGKELRASFEQWAKDEGATAIQMTCLADTKEKPMRRLLKMQGYAAMETSFYKEI